MVELHVREQTKALLNDPLLGEGDMDRKLLRLLESEFLRQLIQYRNVDQRLSQKYQMNLREFLERRTTVQHQSNWEVEKDAVDWESAAGNITALERKLKEIEELTDAAAQ
ncbi:MAG: hypothetical protein R3E79_54415 [Caldilineaceae bacterium]